MSSAWVYSADGRLSSVPVRSGMVSLPEEPVSAVLLPEKTEKDVFLHQVRITRHSLSVRIANPGSDPITVKFNFEVDGKTVCGWSQTIPSGGCVSMDRPISGLDSRRYLPAVWKIISGGRAAEDRLVLE